MTSASDYAKSYVDRLKGTLDRMSFDALDQAVGAIQEAHAQRRQVFIVGNGGSAATASHMMNDLSKGLLGHKGDAAWPRLRVISLTDNVSLLTAWANDTDYRRVFSEPLKNLAQSGDLLIAISASGNSPNILEAAGVARSLGVRVVALTGFGGGCLAKVSDIALIVPSDDYGSVEDVHMILDHIITGYLYERFLARSRGQA